MKRNTEKVFSLLQPETVRMTILSRLMTLTHLDNIMVAEEEAADAAQIAAGSKINKVKIFKIHFIYIFFFSVILGCTVIQAGKLPLCLQASLLAHSCIDSKRPRSLSLLSTAQLLCLLNPAPWVLNKELELDWTAKVKYRHVGLREKEMILGGKKNEKAFEIFLEKQL